jgi:hypothetical protein
MSRSLKRNILKETSKGRKAWYWRTVRRVQKMFLKQGKEIPDKRIIVDDYNYSDYTFVVDYKKTRRV